MGSTPQRHEDIVIQRRSGENALTGAVTQIYAVTYPDHTDQGTERESYSEAEEMALTLAEEKGISVWTSGSVAAVLCENSAHEATRPRGSRT